MTGGYGHVTYNGFQRLFGRLVPIRENNYIYIRLLSNLQIYQIGVPPVR